MPVQLKMFPVLCPTHLSHPRMVRALSLWAHQVHVFPGQGTQIIQNLPSSIGKQATVQCQHDVPHIQIGAFKGQLRVQVGHITWNALKKAEFWLENLDRS